MSVLFSPITLTYNSFEPLDAEQTVSLLNFLVSLVILYSIFLIINYFFHSIQSIRFFKRKQVIFIGNQRNYLFKLGNSNNVL